MELEVKRDIGDEIIMKLKDLMFKIDKLVEKQNEEEQTIPPTLRIRS